MRVLFIVHEQFEAPGAIEAWALERGNDLSVCRLYAGERLDEAPAAELLVVMGGPQSPDTTTVECPHFDSHGEQELIRRQIESGRGVIGVCLGAQLLGQALGARFEDSPETEIGNFTITLTAEGRRDELLADVPDELEAGHWHSCMPGLTNSSVVLASSRGCPRQIVRYGPLAYGLQCHLEFTAELVDGLIENSASDLELHAGSRFVQGPTRLRANSYVEMNRALVGFLDRFALRLADSVGTVAAA